MLARLQNEGESAKLFGDEDSKMLLSFLRESIEHGNSESVSVKAISEMLNQFYEGKLQTVKDEIKKLQTQLF